MTLTLYFGTNLDRTHKNVTADIQEFLTFFTEDDGKRQVIEIPDISLEDDMTLDITNTAENIFYPDYAEIRSPRLGAFYYYFVDVVTIYPDGSATIHLTIDPWSTVTRLIQPSVQGCVIRDSLPPDGVHAKPPVEIRSNFRLVDYLTPPGLMTAMRTFRLVVAFRYIDNDVNTVGVAYSQETYYAGDFNPNLGTSDFLDYLYSQLDILRLSQGVTIFPTNVTSNYLEYELAEITGVWLIPDTLLPKSTQNFDMRFFYGLSYIAFSFVTTIEYTETTVVDLEYYRESHGEVANSILIGNMSTNIIVDSTDESFEVPSSISVTGTLSRTENPVSIVAYVGKTSLDLTSSLQMPLSSRKITETTRQLQVRDAINVTSGAISLVSSVVGKNPIGIASSAVALGSTLADQATRINVNAVTAPGQALTSITAVNQDAEYFLCGGFNVIGLQTTNDRELLDSVRSEGYITNYLTTEPLYVTINPTTSKKSRYIQIRNPVLQGSSNARPQHVQAFQKILSDGVQIWYDTGTELVYGRYDV